MFFLITGGTALVLFLILFLPVLLPLLLVHKKNPALAAKIGQPIVKYAFRFVLFMCGTKTVIRGLENIPRDKAVMFASNHRGMMDAAIAYGSLPVLAGFVSKKSIKKAPIFSLWMEVLDCYFLDRDDPRDGLKMILKSIEDINSGRSVFIAPEGTRSKTLEMNPFKEGSFKMATKTGCPIVPVAISGTDDVFENSKPFVKKATIVIEYGKPIYLSELTDEEKKTIGAYTREKVGEMLKTHEQFIYNNPTQKRLRKEAEAAKTSA